jgi:sirohydrochlorin cobaltochelatase
VTGRPPLLLAAHGTRDPEGVAAFAAFAERMAKLAAPHGTEVAGGFIELSAPPLRAAVAGLVAAGHRRIVTVPLMLAAAGHAKGDVPASLARERSRHPGLAWHYGRPLGPHPVLLELLATRIRSEVELPRVRGPQGVWGAGQAPHEQGGPGGVWGAGQAPHEQGGPGGVWGAGQAPHEQGGSGGDRSPRGSRDAPSILLVGRGSTDPDANAEVVKTTRLLWEGREFPLAETAFVSLARPDVTEGLDRCLALGARRIVVARYFLFPGVLPGRVARQAAEWAQAHPGVEVRCTDVIGDCGELASVVWERYNEAVSGHVSANCDMCMYRVALPGFEHQVGAAQHPHDHPHDPVAHGHSHAD